MDFLSHKVGRDEIKAGDHIYTWRALLIYSHHGIYVGENRVVHFTSSVSDSSSGIISSSSKKSAECSDCRFDRQKSGVVISCLDCFLRGGSLYLFQYGKKKVTILLKRGGTCTTANSDAAEVVLHRAMHLQRHNGFGKYNLLQRNCEDFALYCKTGLIVLDKSVSGCSKQVSSLLGGHQAATTRVEVEDLVKLLSED